ncbi:hypothetical protein DXC89_12305, partial [Prevotella disiens]
KQRSQVARSFPNRYLFSYTNKLTYSFSINCILGIILKFKRAYFVFQLDIKTIIIDLKNIVFLFKTV